MRGSCAVGLMSASRQTEKSLASAYFGDVWEYKAGEWQKKEWERVEVKIQNDAVEQ